MINELTPSNLDNVKTMPTFGTNVVNAFKSTITDDGVAISKSLDNYNQFIDEIQLTTTKVVADEFRKISHTKLIERYNLNIINTEYKKYNNFITNNWLIDFISPDDLEALLDTAFEYEICDMVNIDIIRKDKTKLTEIFDQRTLEYLFRKQTDIMVYIPSKEDLKHYSNIEILFKEMIVDNADDFVNKETLQEIVSEILIKLFKDSEFISAYKVEKIYETPEEFFNILNYDDISGLIKRISPYLSFMTDNYNTNLLIKSADITNTISFNDVININEVKLIIDKEIDLKYNIIKLFNYDDINNIFNGFKIDLFKNDFKPLIEEAVNFNLFEEITPDMAQEWISTTIQNTN